MGRRAVEVRTAESREKERAGRLTGRLTGQQVKTQHLSLVKEKIHMAEEAGAISHVPTVSRLDASGVNTLFLSRDRILRQARREFFCCVRCERTITHAHTHALTETQTLTYIHTHRQRHTHSHTHTLLHMHTHRQTHSLTHRMTDTHTH
ncbi:hypothetical protein EYF80_066443 [Liparis tanakae]|uniref:Uncharacterized protein n=1 Tax=Liparis tanakae TaxID=230148 RepID=A0A4Z2E3D5_9TELE|nr:hypothetical protein EYF80_066443 [Liparis tanakae]